MAKPVTITAQKAVNSNHKVLLSDGSSYLAVMIRSKNSDFRNVRKVKDNQLIATILHKVNMSLQKYRSPETSSGKRFPEKILLIDTKL